MRLLAPAVFLALALPAAPARAAESYDNCVGFIDSLPAVITTQVVWCLRKDLATAIASGRAIDVQANNVTIDCNGFKVGGLAAGPGSTASAIAAYERNNINVRDCLLRGFGRGVDLYFVDGALVEDVVADGSYSYGIAVYGSNCTIRRNRVLDTGSPIHDGDATGIYGTCDILDNTVSYVEQDIVVGIRLHYGSGLTVQGNRIVGITGTTGSTGILAGVSQGAVLRDNHIRGSGFAAIACSYGLAVALGNVTSGFTNGVDAACQDAGNVVLP